MPVMRDILIPIVTVLVAMNFKILRTKFCVEGDEIIHEGFI